MGMWVCQLMGGENPEFQRILRWCLFGGNATAASPMGLWSLRTAWWGCVQGHSSVWRSGEVIRKSITEGFALGFCAGHGVRVEW